MPVQFLTELRLDDSILLFRLTIHPKTDSRHFDASLHLLSNLETETIYFAEHCTSGFSRQPDSTWKATHVVHESKHCSEQQRRSRPHHWWIRRFQNRHHCCSGEFGPTLYLPGSRGMQAQLQAENVQLFSKETSKSII